MKVARKTSRDGSLKYSYEFTQNLQAEAAFFRVCGRERPNIACISTQLGCAVGCPFCAASHSPLFRNLTKEEMLFQVTTILDDATQQVLEEGFEVSFMGMGEPLANLPNLLAAIRELNDRFPQITRVSISTAGPSH